MRQPARPSGNGSLAFAVAGAAGAAGRSKWAAVAAQPLPERHPVVAALARMAALGSVLALVVAPTGSLPVLGGRQLVSSTALLFPFTSGLFVALTRLLAVRGGKLGVALALCVLLSLAAVFPDTVPALHDLSARDGRFAALVRSGLDAIGVSTVTSALATIRVTHDQQTVATMRSAIAVYYAQHDGQFPPDGAAVANLTRPVFECRGQSVLYNPATAEVDLAVKTAAGC